MDEGSAREEETAREGDGKGDAEVDGRPPDPESDVFIVWDSTIPGLDDVLTELVDAPSAQRVAVVGLESGAGLVWSENVERAIRGARNVLAVVNKPNANVGFEIGYALGLGKGVRLVTWSGSANVPAWLKVPPFHTMLVATASRIEALSRLIAEDKWSRVHGAPTPGDDVRLLCPRSGQGSSVRRRLERTMEWPELPEHGWTYLDLPKLLDRVGKVVWAITTFVDAAGEERDGRENAALSVVAGYAYARGMELNAWQSTKAREILDAGHSAIPWDNIRDLDPLAEAIGRAPDRTLTPPKIIRDATAILADYREHVRTVHASLVPFFASTSNKVLSDIFVELKIASHDMRGTERQSRWSLKELLRDRRGERFVILGDPGAGKSTVCRHLAWELACDDSGDSPLPVFVSLARLAAARGDLFDLAEADLRAAKGEATANGLADALRERAQARSGPPVWLLLDGLDEVPSTEVARLRSDRMPSALEGLDNIAVVVTSRSIGYKPLGHRFQEATLLELEPQDGRTLLENWIGADAKRVWDDIQAHPLLAEMGRNPLMLTLIAKLAIEGQPMPRTRIRLYEQVLDVLLRHGAGLEPIPVDDPETTADLLAPLSLELHEAEGECWEKADIARRLWKRCREYPDYDFRLTKVFKTPEQLLNVVSEQTGILGPLHGDGEPWRYLHRSLREYLAARALLEVDRAPYLERAKRNVQHWGETFALLTGMVPEPERLPMLQSLRDADDALALRALPHIEGIAPSQLFNFLTKFKDWSGDYLATLVSTWRKDGVTHGHAKDVLWAWISSDRSTEELAYLYYALEQNGIGVDREAFFRQCGRWLELDWPHIEVVELPPDGESATFWMGSPDGVGHDDERPRHQVSLSPFAIGVTTVTEQQYAKFDSSRPPSNREESYPVVNVSWWDAWLFCRWLPPHDGRRASLATEAQWEYACRAGSDGMWCFGDDEKKLKDYAWCSILRGGVHPVRGKLPNDFGLYDMHGNVWEWCADWKGPYLTPRPATSADVADDPSGPPTGAGRVLRGGSYWSDAVQARSAYRSGFHPGNRNGSFGFRVAFSAASPISAVEDR